MKQASFCLVYMIQANNIVCNSKEAEPMFFQVNQFLYGQKWHNKPNCIAIMAIAKKGYCQEWLFHCHDGMQGCQGLTWCYVAKLQASFSILYGSSSRVLVALHSPGSSPSWSTQQPSLHPSAGFQIVRHCQSSLSLLTGAIEAGHEMKWDAKQVQSCLARDGLNKLNQVQWQETWTMKTHAWNCAFLCSLCEPMTLLSPQPPLAGARNGCAMKKQLWMWPMGCVSNQLRSFLQHLQTLATAFCYNPRWSTGEALRPVLPFLAAFGNVTPLGQILPFGCHPLMNSQEFLRPGLAWGCCQLNSTAAPHSQCDFCPLGSSASTWVANVKLTI